MLSTKETYYYLLIAHKGKLRELFDLDSVAFDYKRSGILINIEPYKDKTIEELLPEWINNEIISSREMWLIGLLLGCPIENTISIYQDFYRKYFYFVC